MDETGADGLPPAPMCPACGAVLVPEPMTTATHVVVAYACPVHGPIEVVDPFDGV